MSEKSSDNENSKEMEIENEKDENKENKKFNFKPIKERETSRFLTKFEKAKILGERAIQISNGSKVMVEVEKGVWDPMIIAEKELREKKINYVMRNIKYKFVPSTLILIILKKFYNSLENLFKLESFDTKFSMNYIILRNLKENNSEFSFLNLSTMIDLIS